MQELRLVDMPAEERAKKVEDAIMCVLREKGGRLMRGIYQTREYGRCEGCALGTLALACGTVDTIRTGGWRKRLKAAILGHGEAGTLISAGEVDQLEMGFENVVYMGTLTGPESCDGVEFVTERLRDASSPFYKLGERLARQRGKVVF